MRFSAVGMILVMAILAVSPIAVLHQWRLQQPEPQAPEPEVTLPDFSSYQDVQTKKREFFNYLLPMIRSANDNELARRDFLNSIDPNDLSEDEQAELDALAKRYRVVSKNLTAAELVARLHRKVDVVPASLVLAQAANESAWGTSRFARQGNNLFGIWCFSPGCGITPQRRADDAKHEVEKFFSVQAGVEKYIRTINSHPAYAELREVRVELRENDQALSGGQLATGLEKYSERGEAYVEEIQSMISFNRLEEFNRKE